jgi:anti-sigma factor RsiW
MNERNETETAVIEEELVAYLDGELTPAEQARVERRLAGDEAYRQKLAQLQRAWDLLDLLQRAEPDAEFTRSTVEMVAIQQEKEAKQEQNAITRKQVLWWLGGGVAIALSAIIGFFVVRYQLEAPERQLLRDLPVIERVDQLRSIESLEFLEKLHEAELFAGESEDAG